MNAMDDVHVKKKILQKIIYSEFIYLSYMLLFEKQQFVI